ncbi:MAG: right-handed parallel beta-helix repeat-containing protein, partial [Bacteroidales bacterium]|nr:right-handed parallel beta-helix repeat-containing protein [Bacteroidales bacterium]
IEHFECGGWIENANSLNIQHCRFRNNYADGMNLSYGSKNSVVEHCSFRNNGDDDMASWSRSTGLCENNVYQYCISENNWRASGLGFFGGKQNKAHHIVISDAMEAGFRITCDFRVCHLVTRDTVNFTISRYIKVVSPAEQWALEEICGEISRVHCI